MRNPNHKIQRPPQCKTLLIAQIHQIRNTNKLILTILQNIFFYCLKILDLLINTK
jgi:hypothetical protein